MKHFNCIAVGVGLLVAQAALAADTGQLPCKTTKECNEAAASIGANAPRGDAQAHTSPTDAAEDQFYWINKINKASTVMLVEEGIFPRDVGAVDWQGRGLHHSPSRAARRQAPR
jgi:argininosuccinate lyase